MSLLSQESSSRFIDWGILHISVGNLVVIALMVVVFVLAIVVPFPAPHAEQTGRLPDDTTTREGGPR